MKNGSLRTARLSLPGLLPALAALPLLGAACTVDPDDSLRIASRTDGGRDTGGGGGSDTGRDQGRDTRDAEDRGADDLGGSDEPDLSEGDTSFPVERPDCGDATDWFRVQTRNGSVKTPLLASGFLSRVEPGGPEVDLAPGDAYSFEFWGSPGWRLSLACAMPDSNDLVYATPPEGVPLFSEAGDPTEGDITDTISLWDAGTETNQELGVGIDQARRQAALDQGAPDANPNVREATGALANLPDLDQLIAVSLAMEPANYFTMRIENVAAEGALDTSAGPVTPTVGRCTFAVHQASDALFTVGEPASDGLEALAEFGGAQPFAEELLPRRGPPSTLGPGLAVVHVAEVSPFFDVDEVDRGEGLEVLAEDADTAALEATLALTPGVRCVARIPAAAPGDLTAFEVAAAPGERLSFVMPVVEANDYFIGTASQGIPLFSEGGEPAADADITRLLAVWETGTEVDEWPGAGVSQSPRQPSSDFGAPQGGLVTGVEVGRWPRLETFVKPSLEPLAE
jgi:hypothetical protein